MTRRLGVKQQPASSIAEGDSLALGKCCVEFLAVGAHQFHGDNLLFWFAVKVLDLFDDGGDCDWGGSFRDRSLCNDLWFLDGRSEAVQDGSHGRSGSGWARFHF